MIGQHGIAILAAHRRGLKLRIVSDHSKTTDIGSVIDELRHRGLPVRVDSTDYDMHHKFAVIDREIALTGSYNWTRSAANHNQENFLVIRDRRVARQFISAFEQLWERLR